jgi:proteasome activator subunit 4
MLNTFLPLLTQEVSPQSCLLFMRLTVRDQSLLTMIPVMTSFLPPSHVHLYIPSLFKLWEAFNSSIIDDRLIEFVGNLSEEHVAGKFGLAGEEGGAEWKDVGIWTSDQWTLLVGKGLGFMSLSIYLYFITKF